MHKNRLLNLLKNNANRGEFRAEANTIYLYDMIVSSQDEADFWGGVAADTFVKTLKGMTGDVSLRINSPGGDVFGARAMAQAIREHDGKVTAHVDGYAASAASFLTSVADETVMGPGSMLMIHKAWSIAIGNANDMTATANLLDKIDGTIVETYQSAAAKRGVEGADFAELMAAETWLTAQEAIDLGLADAVAEDGPKNKAKWDLSAYENAPAAEDEKLTTVGELKVKLTLDTEEFDAALKNAAEAVKVVAHEAEKITETEQKRPNFRSDMLLRPAA
jgi:ATP-dependent protease ClpP protease subunit